jgi:hypothetical protein
MEAPYSFETPLSYCDSVRYVESEQCPVCTVRTVAAMYSQNSGRYAESEQWPVCTVRTVAGVYSQNRGRYVQSEQWPVCTARTGAGMYSQNSPLPLNHPSNTLYKVRLLRPPSASLTALLILLIFKRGLLFKRCQWPLPGVGGCQVKITTHRSSTFTEPKLRYLRQLHAPLYLHGVAPVYISGILRAKSEQSCSLAYRGRGVWRVKPRPQFRRASKIVPNSTRL